MQRIDDYNERSAHLKQLSDDELKQKFWELAEKVTLPMVAIARKHTSPSIERSVLMRMGFSSIDAKEIVNKCVSNGLLGKGAGNCVLKIAGFRGCDYISGGKMLAAGEGWSDLLTLWRKEVQQ